MAGHTPDAGDSAPASASRKRAPRTVIAACLAWTLFQLWVSSPLPFLLSAWLGFSVGIFNNTEARAIHLAFAAFLAFVVFPLRRGRTTDRVPVADWALAVVAAAAAGYLFVFYEALAGRAGHATRVDVAVAIIGILALLEATRRALGPPLTVVAAVFLAYTLLGPWMPDVIAHKGQSLTKVAQHQWLTTEGVFGIALGVSTDFVFLFVLFGALLECAGAGNYFIRLAFAGLGHLRGGPAKASVVASAATGVISGSSIANVATTGVFTIPLMKRVGFPATKAGAVEVASSTNGQLTPPVMGAAAFLMIEYVGISYIEVIKHAFLPALISYVALIYIVHLEACKADMARIPPPERNSLARRLASAAFVVLALCAMGAAVYHGTNAIQAAFGAAAPFVLGALLAGAYLGLLWWATRVPALPEDQRMETLPRFGETAQAGLHYVLPIAVLMWCLVVERFSPGLAAFWAIVCLLFIVLTERPLLAWMRRAGGSAADEFRRGCRNLARGLVNGARNMIGIGVATAAAGLVVGTITLTGIGQVMVEFVELISGGHLLPALLFTAMICIVLGMGLPTTANYIVVSSLMAPVVVALGAANGLVVPLVAVHMFVFYFGILADDTPPVGLAAFAAAGISGADPIRTGVQGFVYDIRTAVLPFMFIFNTQLLMIGVGGALEFALVLTSALCAMLLFAAATQGYWLVKSRLWETAALLLVAFTLFRPGFWWDQLHPRYETAPPAALAATAAALPDNAALRLRVRGETIDGRERTTTVSLPLAAPAPAGGAARLAAAGLAVHNEGERVLIDAVAFGTPADALRKRFGVDVGWEVLAVETESDRPPKAWAFLPALGLLAVVAWAQLRRRRGAAVAA